MKNFFVLLALSLFTANAFAADPKPLGLDIAAVVDNEMISNYDVQNRIRFIIATTNLANTTSVREGIRPQVIETLINEYLQIQHARDEGIEVSEEEITRAIANIEQNRGMKEGAIKTMLESKAVPYSTFVQQIRAQLAWGKIVVGRLRPQVTISEAEVRQARMRPPPKVKKQELRIAVLLLPAANAAQDQKMLALAQKLSSELQAGASYEEVYRQFSGLSSGGNPDTFWVKPNQLDPNINQALINARKGTISQPIRSRDGWLIVKVYDTRSLEDPEASRVDVLLKEILLRLKPEASVEEANMLLQIGEEVSKNPGVCEDKTVANIQNLEDVQIDVTHRQSRLSELPTAVKIIAENLREGEISTPFASSEGIRLYMVCEKKMAKKQEVQLEQLSELLFQRKLELEAQRYLRDLRRDTFIEVRG